MAKAFWRSIRSTRRAKAALGDLGKLARAEVEQTMDRKTKPALIKAHEEVVSDWKNKPQFKARKVVRPDSITVYVFPAGEHKMIWIYVDQGTKPHTMPAVTGKLMVFQAGGTYMPKTAPVAQKVAGGGHVTGGVKTFTTTRKVFTHPGNEPRGFSGQIATEQEPEFKKDMENAFRRAVRRANGG